MQQTPGKGDQHLLSPVEATLAAVWCAALRLGSIGPEENFFYLGGDSLTAVRVVSLARQRGLALHLRDVMQHQTIRDLAVVAGSASATTDAASARLEVPGREPAPLKER
jgi:aryl carrier-like protein